MKGLVQNKYAEEPQILVLPCRGPECKPQEELDTFLRGLAMELYNNAAVYEPNKYTSAPITKDIKKYPLFLDFTERKVLTYIVKRIEIES